MTDDDSKNGHEYGFDADYDIDGADDVVVEEEVVVEVDLRPLEALVYLENYSHLEFVADGRQVGVKLFLVEQQVVVVIF